MTRSWRAACQSLAEFLPESEQDAYLKAVHAADMGDGHGHAPEDCPDRGMYE